MNKNVMNFLKSFVLWLCVFYLLYWGYLQFFGPKEDAVGVPTNQLSLALVDKTPVVGQLIAVQVKNDTAEDWTWPHFCNAPDSLTMMAVVASKEVAITPPTCLDRTYEDITIPAGQMVSFGIPEFNHTYFATPGTYRLQWQFKAGDQVETLVTSDFELREAGFWRKTFRTFISQPLFNALVWLIEVLPHHSLGWAIVILTFMVRLILFWPNQKAMRSQRKLQKLQPHLQGLKKKYGDNQQMLAMETMALYKKHKINPMSSCLPMFLQMPFLIGIYLVVKDGLSPHLSYLLYPFHAGVDLSVVDTHFFGLNLEVPNVLVLPLLVAAAQWMAIKLSMAAAKKQQSKNEDKGAKKKAKKTSDQPDMMESMEQMQKVMQWMLPAMIGFFTATFPAAVGIYWLTSTTLGIAQQKLVNWQLDKPQVRRKETVIEA